jgi:purine-nucleoside phosphorylase
MEGMEEKLNSILGDPEMMGRIMDMARSLGGTKEQQSTQVQAVTSPVLDPAMLQTIASIAGKAGIDNHQQALLTALTPYLSHERIAKLEKAMRAAKLAGMAQSFLGSGALSLLTGR